MNRTWEYASFEVSPGGDIGWVSEIDVREASASFLAARREGLTAVLRFMGTHGWEMTSAIPSAAGHTTVILKREVCELAMAS
jgi:hypothetical protein